MPFLILQCRAHQQRQNLVKKRPRAEPPRLVGDLPHGRLALRRRPALDFEQQRHDGAFLRLFLRQRALLRVLHEPAEVLHVLRLDVRQRTRARGFSPRSRLLGGGAHGNAVRLPDVLHGLSLPFLGRNFHLEARGSLSTEGSGSAQQFAPGGAYGHVLCGGRQQRVSLSGKNGVEGGIGPWTVASFHFPLITEGFGKIPR
mmetsp:Transcript_38155/g.79997  ORF Transcript_38155/g.79997 Transcript_38155/m.79997 type:complete len:200 (-) Transcript_38155:453-1052(-)